MVPTREALHELIERLPDTQISAAQRLLLSLSEQQFRPEFAQSIRRGIEQADAGETVVCQSYGDMVEKLLDKE